MADCEQICLEVDNCCGVPSEQIWRKLTLQLLCCIARQGSESLIRYDWEILCDPAQNNRPIFVRFAYQTNGTQLPVAAFNQDGTPYLGNINSLVACGDRPQIDVEEEPFCDDGVQKIRIQVFTNGSLTSTFWTDVLNNPVPPPANPSLVTAGACVVDSPFIIERPICDNGVQKIVRLCYSGCVLSSVQYFDLANNPVPPPADFNLVTFGACERPELDINYTGYADICVTNGSVRTNYLVRQRNVVNNQTGVNVLLNEYSLDGVNWSVTVPTGIITLGKCSEQCVPLEVLPTITSAPAAFDPINFALPYSVRTADPVGFNKLSRDNCWSVPINPNLSGPVGSADMRYISGRLTLTAPNNCVNLANSTVTISVDVTIDAVLNLNANPADGDIYLWFGPNGGTFPSGTSAVVDTSSVGVGNTTTLSITVPAVALNVPINRLVIWFEPRDHSIAAPSPQYLGVTFNNLKFTPIYDTAACQVPVQRVSVCNAVSLTRGHNYADALIVRTSNESVLWKECLEYTAIAELPPSNNYNILEFNSVTQITVHNIVNNLYAGLLPPISLSSPLSLGATSGTLSYDGNEFIFITGSNVHRYTRAYSGGVASLISIMPITGIVDSSGPPIPSISVITVHPATGDVIALARNTGNDPARLYKLNPVTGVLSFITDLEPFPPGPVATLDFIVTADNRVLLVRQGFSFIYEVDFTNGRTLKIYNLPFSPLNIEHGRNGRILIGTSTPNTQEYDLLTGASSVLLPFAFTGAAAQDLVGGWKNQSLGNENVVKFTRAYVKSIACDTVLTQDHAFDTGISLNIPGNAVLRPCSPEKQEISWEECLEYLPPVAAPLGVQGLEAVVGDQINVGGTCPILAGFSVPFSTGNEAIAFNRETTELYHLDGLGFKRFVWVNKANPIVFAAVAFSGIPAGRTEVALRTRWTDDTLWLMVRTPVLNQVEFYTIDVPTAAASYRGSLILPGDNPSFTWSTDDRLLVSYQTTPGNYVISEVNPLTFVLGAVFITNATIPPALNAIRAINTDVTGDGGIIVTTEGPPGPNLITIVRNDGSIASQCGPHTGNRDTIVVPSNAFYGTPKRFTRVYIKDLVTDLTRTQDHDAVTGLRITLPVGARVGLCGSLQAPTAKNKTCADAELVKICVPELVTVTESVNAGTNSNIPAGTKSVTIRKNNAAGVVNIDLPGGPFQLTANQSSVTFGVRQDDNKTNNNYVLPAINISSTGGGAWSWISIG